MRGKIKGTINNGSTADRVLDLLWIEEGWHTSAGIVMRLSDAKPNTVSKALQRLEDSGRIKARQWNGVVKEWRIV